jgi:hypothetical protein
MLKSSSWAGRRTCRTIAWAAISRQPGPMILLNRLAILDRSHSRITGDSEVIRFHIKGALPSEKPCCQPRAYALSTFSSLNEDLHSHAWGVLFGFD